MNSLIIMIMGTVVGCCHVATRRFIRYPLPPLFPLGSPDSMIHKRHGSGRRGTVGGPRDVPCTVSSLKRALEGKVPSCDRPTSGDRDAVTIVEIPLILCRLVAPPC
jgi:hypothetical protein